MVKQLLTELQYLPAISWFREALRYDVILIEAHENFEKSTYRNRCCIAGPNGKLRLTIPLEHGRNQRSKYSEVKIDYSQPWQKNHWNSLCSCYRNSPYFEFYEDRFEPFYHTQGKLLFDFNKRLLALINELLGLKLKIEFTERFEKSPAGMMDLRSRILPNNDSRGKDFRYHQVFQDRTGFLPDLSIVDLLFNEGPHSKEILLGS